jgi:hypothetical protein
MPDGVIPAVERMVEAEQQPLNGPGAPLFERTLGAAIEDDVQAPFPQDDEHVEVIEGNDEGADEILCLVQGILRWSCCCWARTTATEQRPIINFPT